MFELSLAVKYLIPRRARLSVALIGALSIFVVSLVVWLILVFLSVTEGIEKGWLQKLTTLHGQVRITPTQKYYDSYYYQVDALSSSTGYSYRNLAQKTQNPSLPYDPMEDGALPSHFPKPDLQEDLSLKDPVQGLIATLAHLEQKKQIASFQDFEISGALLRLQILNPSSGNVGYVTQASYLSTIPNRNPQFASLILPFSPKEFDHLLKLASYSTDLSRQDSSAISLKTSRKEMLARVWHALEHTESLLLSSPKNWKLPVSLIRDGNQFRGYLIQDQEGHQTLQIPLIAPQASSSVQIVKRDNSFQVQQPGTPSLSLPLTTPLLMQDSLHLQAHLSSPSFPPVLQVTTSLQGQPLQGTIPWEPFSVENVSFTKEGPSWLPCNAKGEIELPFNSEKESGILVAKSFMTHGVQVGDRGYLSYSNGASGALQEQRIPVFVSGFYDPGVFSLGSKCILAPPSVIQTINASNTSFHLDRTQSNGFLVWLPSIKTTEKIAKEIQLSLQEKGLDTYWSVTPFTQYEFARELLEQFRSDKLLFMVVAVLILMVGCCNIISMGVLLVNDKKKEIGILQSMGATKASVMRIFAIAGGLIGLISTLVGTILSVITLLSMKSLVSFFSFLQGTSSPFNPSFFSEVLPNTLSPAALVFILWITPLLALLSGLIPAIKVCYLQPSTLLKTE